MVDWWGASQKARFYQSEMDFCQMGPEMSQFYEGIAAQGKMAIQVMG